MSWALEKVNSKPPTPYQHEYLLGVRGILVIECFLWMFLQTFVPTVVVGSNDTEGPLYQQILRKTFSVIFWNKDLIYSSFIFLSARSIAIPFLKDPSRSRIAGSAWRRGLTLCIPVAVCLAIVKLAFSLTGVHYMYEFKEKSGNLTMAVPYMIPSAFAYMNSVFNLFWTTQNWSIQAGSTAFPTQTLWIVSAVYQQSYTVYMVMVIIPYTRNVWRVQGAIFMIATAWWVQSWAWYTVSGLIIADMVVNMDYKQQAQKGIRIPKISRRCPSWIPCGTLVLAGLLMQYFWTAWRPNLANQEYIAHTGVYDTPGLNTSDNGREPQPRDDIYLIVLGFFLLLESSDILQYIFNARPLTYLGRRSLSYFLTQSIIMYAIGIKLYSDLRFNQHASFSGTVIAVLVSTLAVVVPVAELFYRLIELPSKVLAHKLYDWITTE